VACSSEDAPGSSTAATTATATSGTPTASPSPSATAAPTTGSASTATTARTSTPPSTTAGPGSGTADAGATASSSTDTSTQAPTSTIVITRVTEQSATTTTGTPGGSTEIVTTGADPMPTSPGDSPAATPTEPLANAEGQSEAYSGIGQITGFGSSCTGFLLDAGPTSGPAYAMTNGHCVGLFDSSTVLRDEPATGATMTFRLFADTPTAAVVVPIRSVRYATMRGTDVAIIQLATTRAALSGLAGFRLGAAPRAGTDIRVVGIPVNGLPAADQVLRAAGCTAGGTHRLLEWLWVWDSAQANDCPGIVGGSSGSPVFHAGSPLVVAGIVNTTTIGAGDLPGCYLGQPCQLDAAGVVRELSTSYAMPVAAWAKCFTANGFVATARGCPTERTSVVVSNQLRAVQPGGSWQATVAGTDTPLTKTGPAATTDCRRSTGYLANAGELTAPLPSVDGFYLLCATAAGADGRPNTAGAGYAVMEVDGTPPVAPIRLSTLVGPQDVRVEPIFAPPEYSGFQLKAGPQAATDCADPDGYAVYRRIPLTIAISDLPATLCVIGQDEAENQGVPHTFELT
jgi:hypothetical protein